MEKNMKRKPTASERASEWAAEHASMHGLSNNHHSFLNGVAWARRRAVWALHKTSVTKDTADRISKIVREALK